MSFSVEIKIHPSAQAFYQHLEEHPEEENAPEFQERVFQIIEEVRKNGDSALARFSQEFDKVLPEAWAVSSDKLEEALSKTNPEIKDVWIEAAERIERFHQKQKEESLLEFLPDGSLLGWKTTALDRVGLYVPGGRAAYSSTLLMNAIPAQVAGVKEIVVVSPPGENGKPHADILATAALLGLEEVYALGGAQALAALAYGTQSIPKVDKITGPGNAYVAEAKRQLAGVVGIDAIAGPTEVLILCDMEVEAELVARDLLAQAEHDPKARAVLVTPQKELAQKVQACLKALIPELPRKEIIQASFANQSGIVLVSSLEEGIELVNHIAPEHLELLIPEPFALLSKIRHAGAIFLGPYSPEPFGDYIAGPNHTLPTGGRARFSSPLSTGDFTKKTSIIQYSPQRCMEDTDSTALFAQREGLFAHAEALLARKRFLPFPTKTKK